jgi:50S ribosome-binding GTPase
MLTDPAIVTFLGRVGHGKTMLLNKLCATNFPSDARRRTCTNQLQFGYTKQKGYVVVDTPGFFASDDVAAHVAAQKTALEGCPLSGIFIVARFGRADEIAESVDKIMSVVCGNQFRLIITHEDVACQEDGYNKQDLTEQLATLLDLSTSHILVVGKYTECDVIENFIKSTLHEPKTFRLSAEQIGIASSLGVGLRRFNKPVQEVEAKISAALKYCTNLTQKEKCYETDVAILVLQKITNDAVVAAKETIFRGASMDNNLLDQQKNLIYGKAGLSLSLKLKEFMKSSNALLSWDVTNIDDIRSQYKKCNHCGAIYIKTEGCNDFTICGSVPSTELKRKRSSLDANFHHNTSMNKWVVQFFWNKNPIDGDSIVRLLKDFYLYTGWNQMNVRFGTTNAGTKNKYFEAGCGRRVSWETMIPIKEEDIKIFGDVKLCETGTAEEEFKQDFQKNLNLHEAFNRLILNLFLRST